MKKISRFQICLLILAVFSAFISPINFAQAATTPTLSVYTGNSGYMIVNVSGDANSTVKLTYYPYGLSLASTITLGSTDANGNFVTTISAEAYNIVNGTSAYATVNNLTSATVLWPSFVNATAGGNSLALNQYSASLSTGQSVVIYSSNNTTLYSANSSASSVASATVSNGQVTILGLSAGTASINICSTQGNCNSVSVTVLTRVSPLALSQTVANIVVGQGLLVYTANSSITKATSNSSNVSAYANNGQVAIIGNSYGTGTITVCNASDTCDSVYVNVQNPSLDDLSLSKNTVSVSIGQTVTVYSLNGAITLSTGNSPKASIAVNSDSNGNQLLITGIESGTETVTVCNAKNHCNIVFVTVQQGATTNNLSLNQYNTLVNVGQTVTVTSANSTIVTATTNSSAATASVSYGQVTIKGQNFGTATITVCNANNLCDQVYVTVQNPGTTVLSLSKTSAILGVGQTTAITSANNDIYLANSDAASVASAAVSGGQLTITGLKIGTATINVCNSAGNCNKVAVTVQNNYSSSTSDTSATTATNNSTTTNSASTPTKTYYTFTRLITMGSIGKDVTQLQNLLIAKGYLTGTKATGKFASMTKRALQAFQKKHGIAAVGYTGPSTRAALNEEMKTL